MTETTEPLKPLPPELWNEIILSAHTAQVILYASVLEDLLEHLIVHFLPNCSNRMRARLFDGNGALGTFSARIDMAFAMGHLDGVTRGDLLHIKDLRNAVAHSPLRLDLRSAEMQEILSQFAGYTKVKDPLVVFSDRVRAVVDFLKSRVPESDWPKIIAAHAGAPGTSPEKSAAT